MPRSVHLLPGSTFTAAPHGSYNAPSEKGVDQSMGPKSCHPQAARPKSEPTSEPNTLSASPSFLSVPAFGGLLYPANRSTPIATNLLFKKGGDLLNFRHMASSHLILPPASLFCQDSSQSSPHVAPFPQNWSSGLAPPLWKELPPSCVLPRLPSNLTLTPLGSSGY